jgi:hypothetical protein
MIRKNAPDVHSISRPAKAGACNCPALGFSFQRPKHHPPDQDNAG